MIWVAYFFLNWIGMYLQFNIYQTQNSLIYLLKLSPWKLKRSFQISFSVFLQSPVH